MTDKLILEMITAISLYCSTMHGGVEERTVCYKQIWACSHKVKQTNAMICELHNCIANQLEKP